MNPLDDLFYQVLTIVFQSGKVYKYQAVPGNVYLSFSTARSKGQYFNRFIRNFYSYKSLDD